SQISSFGLTAIRMLTCFCVRPISASGFSTSVPDSFTNTAVTMKKISMMKTTSSIGVRSILASWLFFCAWSLIKLLHIAQLGGGTRRHRRAILFLGRHHDLLAGDANRESRVINPDNVSGMRAFHRL